MYRCICFIVWHILVILIASFLSFPGQEKVIFLWGTLDLLADVPSPSSPRRHYETDDTMESVAMAAAQSCVNGGIVEGPSTAPLIIVVTGIVGVLFALHLLSQVAAVKLDVNSVSGKSATSESTTKR